MNFIAVKSKLDKFSLLHGLTLNPRHHDTYFCFIGRNLDSWTTMFWRITRHSEYILYILYIVTKSMSKLLLVLFISLVKSIRLDDLDY